MVNSITNIIPSNSFSPINIFKNKTIAFRGAKKVLPTKGNLVYEYNPLRNYRLDYDLYEHDELGRIGLKIDNKTFYYSKILIKSLKNKVIIDKLLTISNIYGMISSNEIYTILLDWNLNNPLDLYEGEIEDWNFFNYSGEWADIQKHSDDITKQLQDNTKMFYLGKYINTLIVKSRAGSLLDFDTELLKFSLKNPIGIEVQPSYDGSVNLILNDDKNFPKLINSRFSTMENDTYQITDHSGNNDTNIYDRTTFDLETNLYKLTSTIAKVKFNGLRAGGNIQVGNYNYYFKLSDVDGNETDFIGESRNVICHIGNLNDPYSFRGGLRDENSGKSVLFTLSNLDRSYDYVVAYFTRRTSDEQGNPVLSAGRISRNFLVKNGTCEIIITGFENIEDKTVDDINQLFEVVLSVKSAALALNILFLGNINKPEIAYKELADLSLRMFPTPYMNHSIGSVNENYIDSTGKYEYYNVENIYDYTSYWDKEIYRFGVVYILNNYTLSPVFNIRGKVNLTLENSNKDILTESYTDPYQPLYKPDTNERVYIQTEDNLIKGGKNLENDKGVVRFNINKSIIEGQTVTPLGVKFWMQKDVINELKKYCKGLIFVRLKRIPTILAQALMIGLDRVSYIPLLPVQDNSSDIKFMAERFINNDRTLTNDFEDRIYLQNDNEVIHCAALCPEAELRSSLYTQMFTGEELITSEAWNTPTSRTFEPGSTYGVRHKVISSYSDNSLNSNNYQPCKITMVEDDLQLKTSSTLKFSSRVGAAEEAWRIGYIHHKDSDNDKAINLVRGSFGPYIGIEGKYKAGQMVNIYISGYSENNIKHYFDVRYDDSSPYYPITNRIDLFNETWYDLYPSKVNYLTYGGDCYVSLFTHRINRNFQDPETPINDVLIKTDTWKDKYSTSDTEKNKEINRGDVNAIQIGHWATFKVLSNINLNLRDLNSSWPTEIGLTGIPRGFFPLLMMNASGNYKIPESNLINGGISTTNSERYKYIYPNVPWIKNQFDTRIMYSDIHVTDAFKNGYRVFKSLNYRDYTKDYGAITKIISWVENIICICEHGILLIPVNERVLAGAGPGGPTYVNTVNVLPQNPKVISNTFGSSWLESIEVSDNYIYGIDTIGKKIWRTDGESFEIISDFKVLKFLNDYITLREREKTPLIGVRNIKTHYNAFKKDIMFTFYDNLYGEEEKVWNICYNEILNKWITFYSWLPSYSASINNIYFSFDRNTSKFITKLGISNEESEDADGICLSNVVFTLSDLEKSNPDLGLLHRYNINTKEWESVIDTRGIIGKLNLKNRNLPKANGKYKLYLDFKIEEDPYGNFSIFEIVNNIKNLSSDPNEKDIVVTNSYLRLKDLDIIGVDSYQTLYDELTYYEDLNNSENTHSNKIYYIYTKVNILYNDLDRQPDLSEISDSFKNYVKINGGYFSNVIAIAPYSNINSQIIKDTTNNRLYPGLTTDFWKHGKAGIIDISDDILPTKWYGKIHPFEFEFIVADNPFVQKIFNNLYIISNKAEPESFHFEVVGEGYDFTYDKKNMYYRLELTKEMFLQSMYKDILFNKDYKKIKSKMNTKSVYMPLYYDRVHKYNEIYDSYLRMTSDGRDYLNLSGGEILWDKQLNEFKVVGHQKGMNIKSSGRLRGNMHYKEDVWNVEIRPINFVEKNEIITDNIPIIISRIPNYDIINLNTGKPYDNPNQYPDGLPLLPIKPQPIPFKGGYLGHDVLLLDQGTIYSNPDIKLSKWSSRKETRFRDKYIRIKVRYSGKDHAVISALKTIYTNSYA